MRQHLSTVGLFQLSDIHSSYFTPNQIFGNCSTKIALNPEQADSFIHWSAVLYVRAWVRGGRRRKRTAVILSVVWRPTFIVYRANVFPYQYILFFWRLVAQVWLQILFSHGMELEVALYTPGSQDASQLVHMMYIQPHENLTYITAAFMHYTAGKCKFRSLLTYVRMPKRTNIPFRNTCCMEGAAYLVILR